MNTQTLKKRLLIVDDEALVFKQIKWGLANEGYELFFAETLKQAISFFKKHKPQVVTLDLNLSSDFAYENKEGFILLKEFLELYPATKVIMITGQNERENTHKALKLGAYDFYNKPIDIDDLKVVLKRAFHLHKIEEEIISLQKQVLEKSFYGIIGNSSEMQAVLSLVERVAVTDASVLILGESGTGKELIAKSIHNLSPRKKEPFVAINCGAIPENLIEGELFGHEKGSFTGATSQRIGKVEAAQNGTIFLDEIGDMPLSMQVKLLRFLQEKEIERLGANNSIKLNVRIIAATNRDLRESVKNKTFREDLFFRLNVVPIQLPPLRERGDDVLVIAASFLKAFSEEYSKNISGYTNEAAKAMKGYGWPGNIRELENKVRRGVVVTKTKFVDLEDLDLSLEEVEVKSKTLRHVREKAEREFIIESLGRNNGNISKTAKEISVSRPTFHDMLKKYQISIGQFKNI